MLRATPVICEIRSVSELNKNVPLGAIAVVLGAFLFQPLHVQAADFQVVVTQSSVPQCSLTGSMLEIEPITGKVTIDLSTGFNCYPMVVSSIANSASLSVTGSATVGGGTNGTGTVNLQLVTGLTAPTPGVTCVPDGYTSSNVSITSPTDWSTPLCTNNCGATVTRSVGVQNTSATLDGNITFKAKCTYQDSVNANLSSVRANIQSTPSVTVLHGSEPVATYCQSVTELADSKGLTDAMRMTAARVDGGTLPGTSVSFLEYTSVFGVSPNTYPSGSGDTLGYGFPGTNKGTLIFWLPRDKYVSLKFRAPSNGLWIPRNGTHFYESQSSVGLTAAIAPCPGQFDTDANFPALAANCKAEHLGETFWTTSPTSNSCKLVPGKTYYLNIINAGRSTPSQSYCAGGAGATCKIRLTNQHSY